MQFLADMTGQIIKQMWPYIGKFVKTLMKTTIEPVINEKLPSLMTPFEFQTVDFGSIVSYIRPYHFCVLYPYMLFVGLFIC